MLDVLSLHFNKLKFSQSQIFCNNSKDCNASNSIICQNIMSNDYVKIYVTKANIRNDQIIFFCILYKTSYFIMVAKKPSSLKAIFKLFLKIGVIKFM